MLTAISTRLVQFATTMLLARLLVPNDFGVVAVALVIINSLALFRDMGLAQALIHQQDDIEEAADTAFLIIPLAGAVLVGLTVLAAPTIGAFFDVPEATMMIRVLAIGLAIASFGVVPSTLLQREMRFKRKFIPEIAPIAGYCTAATVSAFLGLGAWSLVVGELVRNLVISTVIWPFSSWRPSFKFHREMAQKLLRYGWHIVGAAVSIFLFTTIDNIAIAKVLGTEQLGFYVLAFMLGTLPATQMAQAVSLVIFPAFSQLQTDNAALGRAFARTITYNSVLTAPIAFATLSLGPVLLTSFYGNKWEGAVEALQILTIYGFFFASSLSSFEILKSIGKPNLLARVNYVQLALVLAFLYPTVSHWGIAGVAVLFTTVMMLGAVALFIIACRAISRPLFKTLSGGLYPTSFAGLGALASWLVAYRYLDGDSLVAFIGGVITFIVVYTAMIVIFYRSLVVEFAGLLRGAFSSSSE